MSEIDYQLALLLQHKFEQEYKNPKEYNSDVQLARSLQEQFEKEYNIEKPGQGLVYNSKNNTNRNSAKCLTDPSWEVIDPTPDIHMLFMAFNDRFFWRKLLSVCVSWSKRMTSCAGICSYQGRGGMCSITLSEPLLKLRPRKDLVETLLHEMIHAYLFVTHSNKDRDGHGPEFHKHMYRINGEAGTNITVYHDFHDEVKLYKQHWWRCDGPCQRWKPYFGMVRRAMNRAPGPQDRWWGEHSRNCGGNFIKVKEPEKPQKKTTAKENKKPAEDIRKFIPSVNTTRKSKSVSSTSKLISSGNNKSLENVNTVSSMDNNSSKIGSSIGSNIFGFTNIHGSASTSTPKRTSSDYTKGAIGRVVKNNSNTIVINKKPSTSTRADPVKIVKPAIILNTTMGRTLSNSSPNNNSDYSVVRNHWLNKFPNSASDNNNQKRSLPQESSSTRNKIPKLTPNKIDLINSPKKNIEIAECPVCTKKVDVNQLNDHLDSCLEAAKDNGETKCIICGKKIPTAQYEVHINECSRENLHDNVFDISQESGSTPCSFCGKHFSTKNYNDHVLKCSKDYVDNIESPKGDIIDLTHINMEEKPCSVCKEMVLSTNYDCHVEKCLLKLYDDMEARYSNNEEKVDCLACGENIRKSELSSHLDDCMSLSRVFEDDNEPKEGETSNASENDANNKYNCPFCMTLISEREMGSHITICLNTVDSSAQVESDKILLKKSLVDTY